MFSLDDRPALPETPDFGADMEQFLMSAARRTSRTRTTRRIPMAVAAAGDTV